MNIFCQVITFYIYMITDTKKISCILYLFHTNQAEPKRISLTLLNGHHKIWLLKARCSIDHKPRFDHSLWVLMIKTSTTDALKKKSNEVVINLWQLLLVCYKPKFISLLNSQNVNNKMKRSRKKLATSRSTGWHQVKITYEEEK